MTKIVILGRGLTGLLSALRLNFHNLDPQTENIDVELYYDSEIPPVPFGQGTLPNTPILLYDTLQFNMYENPIGATPKLGILYENWGHIHDKFFHTFPPGKLNGIHYDVDKLQEYIIANLKFPLIDKKINNYDEVDADYVIDCRGFPTSLEGYKKLNNPLNSVILGRVNKPLPHQLWSGHTATKDGWMFTIPLQDYVSYGYLYNNEFTSKEVATDSFKELVNDIEIVSCRSFENYISETPVIDGRIFLNGNKLYFLEPMEANALAVHSTFLEEIIRTKLFKMHTDKYLIKNVNKLIEQVESYLLYHYSFGSRWKNDFWDYAESLKKFIDPDLVKLMDMSKNISNIHLKSELFTYGIWSPYSVNNAYKKFN